MVTVNALQAGMDKLAAAVARAQSRVSPWTEGAEVDTAGAIPTVKLDSDPAKAPLPVKANLAGPLTAGQRVWVEHWGTRLTITDAPSKAAEFGPFELTMLNSWAAAGAGWGEPEVARVGPSVYLTGLATAPGSPFVDLAILPSWAWPRRSLRFTAVSSTNNAHGMVNVASTGAITLSSTLWDATPTGYINLTATWQAADWPL